MTYRYNQSLLKDRISRLNLAIIGIVFALVIAAGSMSFALQNANAATVNGCDFDDSTLGTWSLLGDCTATGPINVPADTTVEGNGYTISAGYNFGSNADGTNTVIGVINADNVTINNLAIDGSGGTGLHGVNVYVSDNVTLDGVTINNNDKSGLVVNGSTVTVNNITTSGNTWHGINVAQGSGVTTPAILTVNGVSHQTDLAQIYVDHYLAGTRDVVDTNNQYAITDNPVGGPTDDRLYTLIPKPQTKDDCKKGSWEAYGFKNQGQCVASVVSKRP